MHDDDHLIRRMQDGDAEAAEALVNRYYEDIVRYCRWHAPQPTLAEDAAQETFLKFIRYLDRYKQRGHCRAFLYQIARHTCIDMARRHYLHDAPLDEAPEPVYDDAALTELQARESLRDMVAQLPETQREIVLLRFGQSLTLREIAEVTALPLRTVQSRLRAALKRLRTIYEKGEER
ncbi:MAG: sigma-70 family RNA polymerase sigma factor [Peptococcaceae bacterium]|nr:sigma-70 family RNA polymerase sigma factor [Peptococcaceae bacterium]